MRSLLFPILLLAVLFAAPLHAWGTLGHRTVALLASRSLTPSTARRLRTLLKPRSLLSAATWPDYYSHTPDGRYSASWHYIDAMDSPPRYCNVSYTRDCPADRGCIVSAIANHTVRARDVTVDWDERQKSAMWVVHFLGDVHQPLHTENMDRGGNGIKVLWGGRSVNLHHVWDSSIAEGYRGGNSVRHAVEWAAELEEKIEKGEFGPEKEIEDSWGKCIDIKDAENCAVEWATETNKIICEFLLPEDYVDGGLEETELKGGEYEKKAREIIEKQIAMAGWRLARWLNSMFEDLSDVDLRAEYEGTPVMEMGKEWLGDDEMSMIQKAFGRVKDFFGFAQEL